MFNDCGVAIEMLRRNHGLKRIAYVDIDAHHGDGVYYGFESDLDLIFADIHEDGRHLYPGTGSASETGLGVAAGTKLNIPMPPGSDDAAFAAAWPRVLAHLRKYKPEFILLQAGADSVEGDPITHMRFTADTHERAARDLAQLAEELGHGRVLGTGGGRVQPHQPCAGMVGGRAGSVGREVPGRETGITRGGYSGSVGHCELSRFPGPHRLHPVQFAAPGIRPCEAISMFRTAMTIGGFDPELETALKNERQRQEDHIELIASENYVSPRVLEAQGTVLTNKYAEGYPGKRYYGGCEFVDVAETLAIERAKKLFGADYADVQPHSGSQANAAAYLALIQPGDTILGMSLDHGGHLTHGAKVNFSGKLFRAVQYGIRPDNGEIDYDALAAQAVAEKPKMIVAGFSAYSRYLDFKKFREIADSVGAYLFVDMAHVAGLVAAGLYPDPIPCSDVVTTTTHKTTARSARWSDPGARQRRDHQETEFARVPRYSGWPADARDRRESRGVPRSASAGIQGVSEASRGERACDRRAAAEAWLQYNCPFK